MDRCCRVTSPSELPPQFLLMKLSLPQLSTYPPRGGNLSPFNNPLWGFTFSIIPPSFQAPFSGWSKTLRRPTDTTSGAQDNVNGLKRYFSLCLSNVVRCSDSSFYLPVCLRPTLLKLSSTHITSWRLFIIGMRSATILVEHPALPTVLKVSMILSMANSVEAVTCRILNLQVGDQANAFLPKSLTAPLLFLRCTAFDSIFYLHHSNVDHMISLWQALNYNTWVSPGLSSRGTWRTRANGPDGQQYRYNERDTCVLTTYRHVDLTPFWSTPVGYFTSNASHS